MFNKISSLTLAVLLFLVMFGNLPQQNPDRIYPYLYLGSILFLILASLAVNYKRLNFTWPHLLLPVICLISAGSVFALIANPALRLIFLLAASIGFYFVQIKLGKESHFLQNIYLLCAAGLYIALFAANFYFHLQIWWLIPAAFLLSYVLAIQGLAGFSLPAKKYFYFLIALICTELVWGLSFWPTHYFVNGIVAFSAFYLLWLFSFSAFFARLTFQKIAWQITLIAIVLILTLGSAAWRPVG